MADPAIVNAECRKAMAAMPAGRFHCCITSPPYFGMRKYAEGGHIGLEASPAEFVEAMRSVFGGRDNPVGVWRVLRDDACLFVNLGDSYASSGAVDHRQDNTTGMGGLIPRSEKRTAPTPAGFKPKDLLGMPWRVAFALQADGWYLRDAIIWAKSSPMPGSQR
ncbi:MAG TPA: DNA methyltransferase, partial [Phycisphaerae bacterium]|nr:DNA methyltransferase [Phycisphaerae bacterium]